MEELEGSNWVFFSCVPIPFEGLGMEIAKDRVKKKPYFKQNDPKSTPLVMGFPP